MDDKIHNLLHKIPRDLEKLMKDVDDLILHVLRKEQNPSKEAVNTTKEGGNK